MGKEWTGTVRIEAPVEQVFAYLADFTRHPEWDASTHRVELHQPGDANGVGAVYRAYESLSSLAPDTTGSPMKDRAGLADREVKELVPNRRIAWHTHTVPRMGISADASFDLEPDGDGTTVNQTVRVKVPGVLDAIGKAVFRQLDDKQTAQWESNLQNLKQATESGTPVVREPALAGD